MIYHLTLPEYWEPALETGQYEHPTYKTEGFIHCSTKEQLYRSAAKHFSDKDEILVLFLVEKRIKDKLRWEAAKSGELFPHIYGTIPVETVESVRMLIRKSDGEYELD